MSRKPARVEVVLFERENVFACEIDSCRIRSRDFESVIRNLSEVKKE